MGTVDWAQLSKAEGASLADAWHGERDARLQWLAREASVDTDEIAREDLIKPWIWYGRWRQSIHDDVAAPLWWRDNGQPGSITRPYRVDEASAMDALAHLFAKALILGAPSLVWVLPNRGKRKIASLNENMPCLMPLPEPAIERNVIGLLDTLGGLVAMGITDNRVGEDALVRQYDLTLEHVAQHRARHGGGTEVADGAEEPYEVVGTTDDDEWTHLIGFTDEVAHEDEAVVAAIIKGLQATPEVEAVHHQEREEVAVRARSLTVGDIHAIVKRLWSETLPASRP